MKVNINGTTIELKDEEITQAIEKKEELKVIDETLLLSVKADHDTLIENIKKDEYKKGRKEGVEIEWKETKRKLGLEIDGKNGDEIIDAYRKKVLEDAKIEPNKKITELNDTVGQLRINLKKAEDERDEVKNSFTQKEKQIKINSSIFTAIPDKAVNEKIKRSDVVAMFTGNGYSVDIQEEKEVVTFNGEVLKNDKTLEPLKLSDVMNQFVTDKGLIVNSGGTGGKDFTQQASAGTIEAFEKEMKEKDILPGSKAFADEMGERIKNKTLKI